jgi:hypothetical protein
LARDSAQVKPDDGPRRSRLTAPGQSPLSCAALLRQRVRRSFSLDRADRLRIRAAIVHAALRILGPGG